MGKGQGKPAFNQVWDNRRTMMTKRKPVVDEDRLKAVFVALADQGVEYMVFGRLIALTRAFWPKNSVLRRADRAGDQISIR